MCVTAETETERQEDREAVVEFGVVVCCEDHMMSRGEKRKRGIERDIDFFSSVLGQAHACKRTHKLSYTKHLSK